jgi:hypothetical protein
VANSYIMVNGIVFHPELPMPFSDSYIGAEKRMASGALRRAHVVTKRKHGPYRSEEMTEAQLAAAEAAITYASSFTYRAEDGIARTAVLQSWSVELVRSTPDVEGASMGTGEAYYTATFELEDV